MLFCCFLLSDHVCLDIRVQCTQIYWHFKPKLWLICFVFNIKKVSDQCIIYYWNTAGMNVSVILCTNSKILHYYTAHVDEQLCLSHLHFDISKSKVFRNTSGICFCVFKTHPSLVARINNSLQSHFLWYLLPSPSYLDGTFLHAHHWHRSDWVEKIEMRMYKVALQWHSSSHKLIYAVSISSTSSASFSALWLLRKFLTTHQA